MCIRDRYERAKKGARFGILCSMSIAELVGICINLFAPYLIAAFNSDPEVVAYGVTQARIVTLFYFLLAFSHCMAGILRGAGRSAVPMLVMMVCWCIIRIASVSYTHLIHSVFSGVSLTERCRQPWAAAVQVSSSPVIVGSCPPVSDPRRSGNILLSIIGPVSYTHLQENATGSILTAARWQRAFPLGSCRMNCSPMCCRWQAECGSNPKYPAFMIWQSSNRV